MRMTKNPQDQMINFYTYDPSQQKQKQTKHKGTGLKVLVNLQTFVSTVGYFFPIYNVLFQMHQSNEHQVVLKKVKIGSSGRYKCEVGGQLNIDQKEKGNFFFVLYFQVMSKKDSHYYSGPPFDAISQVGQMQVVGKPLKQLEQNFNVMCSQFLDH